MSQPANRRTFTKAAVAGAGLAAWGVPAALQGAPSERVRVGVIGTANRGCQDIKAFLEQPDCEIVALCDVYQPHLAAANKLIGGKAAEYADFRKLLEHKGLDAVLVATPDHWHAIQTVNACDAGKDVYVEKPLSITVVEGRKMVEAARRNNRVVQVGTHRRSSTLYAQLAQLASEGKVGKITVARAYRASNMYPDGMGRAQPSAPPAELNWDMWLGPRPARPYQDNIAPYEFRWWHLYSSQMANWGVHYLDAIRWVTGELAPSSVCAMGGVFAVNDDRTVPDTLEATFQFASGRIAVFGQYEASGNPVLVRGEIEFRGTLGTVYTDEKQIEIVPERGGQFQSSQPRMEPVVLKDTQSNSSLTEAHARNFLDCIKSRALPNADVEIGHRSTTMSHLANISLATGRRLEWDAQAERFIGDDAANDMLHYEYRKPWKLD